MGSLPQQPGFLVAALYRFHPLGAPGSLRQPLSAFCSARGIKGTLLIAPEGINGTVAGSDAAIAELVTHIESIPGLASLEVKYGRVAEIPFHRMKVRLKKEIVTMGVPGIDPLASVGTYVPPSEWNALISDPDTVVVDTRNAYEVALGTFRGAVDPRTASFAAFPAWAEAHREELKGRKVAMFCTGGIRCEKATAFMRSIGIGDVYHLKGGILKYLENVPEENSLWQGECFVFDQRVSLTHGLQPGRHGLCHACRRPLAPEDRERPEYEEGVSCHRCAGEYDEADRRRFRERQRQIAAGELKFEGNSHSSEG